MKLRSIKNDKEYVECLKWVDEMLEKGVNAKTPEGKKLQAILLLVKRYEDIYYPITPVKS